MLQSVLFRDILENLTKLRLMKVQQSLQYCAISERTSAYIVYIFKYLFYPLQFKRYFLYIFTISVADFRTHFHSPTKCWQHPMQESMWRPFLSRMANQSTRIRVCTLQTSLMASFRGRGNGGGDQMDWIMMRRSDDCFPTDNALRRRCLIIYSTLKRN